MKRTNLIVVRLSIASVVAVAVLWATCHAGAARAAGGIFGFTAKSAESQRALESRLLELPSPERIEVFHRFLTDTPHVAGSPRDRELAEWVRDRWREFGLEDVQLVEHEVLLPYPEEVSIEMTAPNAWRAPMKEDAVPGDRYSAADDVGVPYHAYSASGEVEAPVVYAASGNPADYDWLASHGIDVKGKIALVRYSVPYSYRGFKALTAQQRGAAGLLVYSDPAEDGYAKGKVYPDGPWGPESHIQRGGIVYDFMVPGDPLTPGWASVPGARRIAASAAISLPTIMSAPLSYKDARVILEALGGPEAPKSWQGALPFTYHVGPGPAIVKMRLKMDDKVRPIWTVTGKIRGTAEPEKLVVLGNHRDAWIYGGVDPSSGSAAMMELARVMGALAREGTRPKRTVVFASWDAEEFTLTSSTEWGEQFADELGEQAVAYINVDSAASGPNFDVSAVPSLNQLVEEVAQAVGDPNSRIPIAAAKRQQRAAQAGVLPSGSGSDLVKNRLGSGSDYTVFLNFLGVPIVDMSFDGPYGVYHSMYDNHLWVSRIGDPGFRYHAAMVRLWALMATRLANADVLPLDYRPYAARVQEFLKEVERRWEQVRAEIGGPGTSEDLFGPARDAAERLAVAAAAMADRADKALQGGGPMTSGAAVNRALMAAERALLDPGGIPGRPWYRHQIYAPKFTYAPEVLPGVAEAIDARDAARLKQQVTRLAAALDRAAAALTSGAGAGSGLRPPFAAVMR